jgi:AcrR family transcriptional regulator
VEFLALRYVLRRGLGKDGGLMPRILTKADIAEFRDRTCAAAAALFVEVGYSKFTMRDLASRLGASAMTPYRYFDNKNAILGLVKAKGFSMLAGRVEAIIRDADMSAKEKLGPFVRAYMSFSRDESAFYKLMFQDDCKCLSDCSELEQEERRFRDLVVEYAAQLSGPGMDADCLAELLWSVLHGAAMFRLSQRSAVDDDLLVEAIAAMPMGDQMEMINPMEAILRSRGSAPARKPVPTQ